MQDSLFAELFIALDIVVMERLAPGTFRLAGPAPDWFGRFYGQPIAAHDHVRPGDLFPFLAHFLGDAEEFWTTHQSGQLLSGPWEEVDASGQEHYFEATAVCLSAYKLLLLAFPKTAYEEKQAIIQRARENNLAYARFNKELLQKEVLLHCIVHDLSAPLTSIMLGLSLLDSESMTPDGHKTVDICMIQATRQKELIQQILDVFAAEVGAIETAQDDPPQTSNILQCARAVVDTLRPACVYNQVALHIVTTPETAVDWCVMGEASRLERVLYNLVDNTIRHSPGGASIRLTLTQEATGILATVEDEGPGVPEELVDTIFEKFSQSRIQPGKAGLGLYFCRITVQGWGGRLAIFPAPAVAPSSGSVSPSRQCRQTQLSRSTSVGHKAASVAGCPVTRCAGVGCPAINGV